MEMEKSRRTSKRSRKAPSPNSILDRKALVRALDERGLAIKSVHIDAFYQSLHRQHYPDLAEFINNYYRHEEEASRLRSRSGAISSSPDEIVVVSQPLKPLKNRVTTRKNKNKTQLPKAFLNFIQDPENGFVTLTSKVAQRKTSADGSTTKLAIQLHDGQLVESVIMRYVSPEGSRASLCVSSQCGCAMGCVSIVNTENSSVGNVKDWTLTFPLLF